jgi:uncharacterized membrane protein
MKRFAFTPGHVVAAAREAAAAGAAITGSNGLRSGSKGQRRLTVPTVTVLKFTTEEGANHALDLVQDLQSEHLIKLHDAAVVSWPMGKKKPRTRQMVDLVGVGALSGMFWGMLFGFIFLAPVVGMAVGAAFGALGGAFRDYGIDDEFIKRVRSQVTEGTSALFLMTSEAVVDRVADAVKNLKFEVIATNLPKEEEQKLRKVIGQE